MSKENAAVDSILVQDFNGKQIDLLEKYQGKAILAIIYNNQCLGIHTSFNNTETTEADIISIFTIDELPFPIYLDYGHAVYDQFHSAGTPQWVLITKEGILSRSIFGSQENAQNRLMYALEELV